MKKLLPCTLLDDIPIKDRLVYVEWADARGGTTAWTPLEALAESQVSPTISVGLLATCTDERLVLIPHLSQDTDTGFGEVVIPRGMVRRIWQINIGPELKHC